MKKITTIAGLCLIALGVVMILLNTTITQFGFIRFGGYSSGGALIIFFILSVAYAVFKRTKSSLMLVVVSVALMVVSLIMGMRLYFHTINALEGLMIFGFLGCGIGFLFKGVTMEKQENERG